MATQTAAISESLERFAADLLAEREVIPRARIIVEQIAKLIPSTAVVLYLADEGSGGPHWAHKASKGTVTLPKSSVPHDAGTLGEAGRKKSGMVFAGETTPREKYSHLDIRRTVVSLAYSPILLNELLLGMVELVSFDHRIETIDLEKLDDCIQFAAIALAAALAHENERNGQFQTINRLTQLYDLERSFNSTLKM